MDPTPEHKETGLVSVEDYLEMEERSEIRHEYVGGMLYAMTGGTRKHSNIGGNAYVSLRQLAEPGPCEVSNGNVRLNIGEIWYYPDVMVVCDPDDDDPRWVTRPCLLVEVLSPSSESTDRREKLLAYRSIETLRTYLIVHQDRRWVERHFRDEDDRWARADHVGDGASVPIPCPEGRLTLAEIYAGI